MTHRYADPLRNAMLDQITTRAGSGAILRFHEGALPVTKGSGYGTVLAQGTCSATFAPAAVNGVLTLNAITFGNASASGVAGCFSLWRSDGTTFVYDAPITDANLNQTTFTAGQPVSITGYTITEGNA